MRVPLDRQRFALSMVLAAFIFACGSSPTHVPNEYTVVGTLLSVRGETAKVCAAVIFTLPPTWCGGVTIYGVDIRTAPGAHVFSNGTVDTGLVRVVGSWDGQALTLVGALRPAGASEIPPWPACAAGAKNAFLPDSTAQRINDDTPCLSRRGKAAPGGRGRARSARAAHKRTSVAPAAMRRVGAAGTPGLGTRPRARSRCRRITR